MYATQQPKKSKLKVGKSYEGESIEKKVSRMMNNKEPIEGGRPLIFTERSEGVRPETDIRTDRFEIALDGMDYVHRSALAKREARHKPKDDGKPESSQATGGDNSK